MKQLHRLLPRPAVPVSKEVAAKWPRWALQRLVVQGGVCRHNSYFAANVMKSFGIPTTRAGGDGTQHVWTNFIDPPPHYTARIINGGHDGNCGTIPVALLEASRWEKPQKYQFEMIAAAMGHSYEGWVDAMMCCTLRDLIATNDAKSSSYLIEQALASNPYCVRAWHLLADEYSEPGTPLTGAQKVMNRAWDELATQPGMVLDVFSRLNEKRLAQDGLSPEIEAMLLSWLDDEAGRFGQIGRWHLTRVIRIDHFRYLSRTHGLSAAHDACVKWLCYTERRPRYFEEIYTLARRSTREGKHARRMRIDFVRKLYDAMPRYLNGDASSGAPHANFLFVANAYAHRCDIAEAQRELAQLVTMMPRLKAIEELFELRLDPNGTQQSPAGDVLKAAPEE